MCFFGLESGQWSQMITDSQSRDPPWGAAFGQGSDLATIGGLSTAGTRIECWLHENSFRGSCAPWSNHEKMNMWWIIYVSYNFSNLLGWWIFSLYKCSWRCICVPCIFPLACWLVWSWGNRNFLLIPWRSKYRNTWKHVLPRKEVLREVQGYLVQFPLDFLQQEDLTPSVMGGLLGPVFTWLAAWKAWYPSNGRLPLSCRRLYMKDHFECKNVHSFA